MTDEAITEHIIYLINEHKKQTETLSSHYKDYLMSLSSEQPIYKPNQVSASTLLDRIQATLQNREQTNE
jgi:hypothetical protein